MAVKPLSALELVKNFDALPDDAVVPTKAAARALLEEDPSRSRAFARSAQRGRGEENERRQPPS